VSTTNQELENQNAYLRHHIEEAMKQAKKAVKSPFDSVDEDDGKSSSYP